MNQSKEDVMVFRFVFLATICGGVCMGALCLPPNDLSESPPAIRETDLVYELTGGEAGIDHAVRITPDGQVFVSDGQSPEGLVGLLSNAQGNQLNASLEDWDAPPSITAESICCDGFSFGITYRGRMLSWSDGQENVPNQLWEIANLVTAIEQGF
jgi:hypothetical protein